MLAKRDVLMGVIREELVAVRDAHKAPRRTEIVADDTGTLDVVSLVEDEAYVVTVTARGYVRAVPERSRKSQVANPGSATRSRKSSKRPRSPACCSSPIAAAPIAPPVHELPKERLTAAQNLFQLGDGEQVVAVLDVRMHEDHPNVVFVTALGTRQAHRALGVRRGVGPPERHRRDEGRRWRSHRERVPRLGRLRIARRHRERSGDPLRGGRRAPGGSFRGRHPRDPVEGRRPSGRRLRGRARGDRRSSRPSRASPSARAWTSSRCRPAAVRG